MTNTTPPKFMKRERQVLIVCTDAGGPRPANDLDDSRTYGEGETVELHLADTMPAHHPDALRAVVVANGDRIRVRALHEVFAMDRRTLVARDDVFEVDRDCVFAVWP